MFDSLDDQIKHDTELETTKVQRLMRWAAAFVATVAILGGLYYGMRFLE